MNLTEYQIKAARTAEMDHDKIIERLTARPGLLELSNYAEGAAGEAGEIINEVKKVVHHGHDLNKEKILEETGDLLWYTTQVAAVLGFTLEEVMAANIKKIEERYPSGFDEERSRNREE
jgi:NTP pyrophosphatase (non-canonical NTP hydrolase)